MCIAGVTPANSTAVLYIFGVEDHQFSLLMINWRVKLGFTIAMLFPTTFFAERAFGIVLWLSEKTSVDDVISNEIPKSWYLCTSNEIQPLSWTAPLIPGEGRMPSDLLPEAGRSAALGKLQYILLESNLHFKWYTIRSTSTIWRQMLLDVTEKSLRYLEFISIL